MNQASDPAQFRTDPAPLEDSRFAVPGMR